MTSLSPAVALLKLFGSSTAPRRFWRQGLPTRDLKAAEAAIAPVLVELEALRRRTILTIDLLGLLLVPVGTALGVLAGYLLAKDTVGWVIWSIGGAFAGAALAYAGPEKSYRRTYKARVLPHFAACFGDLTYRAAASPDLKRLCKLGFLPAFGVSAIEDEIVGTYRGVRLAMLEAHLATGGKNSEVVFNGLIVALHFPGRFSGTTVVTKDSGWTTSAGDMLGLQALDRVRLEDPRFEARYQVYGSDQIEARALLTPAVMERIMELERHAPHDPPRLLAEPGGLVVTISKRENLFEPPSLAQPATAVGDMLAELSHDLGSVLRFVDAVLELSPLAAPT